MKPLKESITPKQEANIRKHCEFLCFDPRVKEVGFDMSKFGTPECGTAGCSAGYLNITMNDRSAQFRTNLYLGIKADCSEWYWAFSANWIGVDNTPVGAAGRLLYFLEVGLPVNWGDIHYGKVPYPERLQNWIDKVNAIKNRKALKF